MSARIRRPVLRYHGGKFRLASWIIGFFPTHRTYVEPFGGGGSVLMRKARTYAEVYNDQWGDVVNVFRVLRDPATAAQLAELLRLTPFARDEFEAPWPAEVDAVERARRAIFRSMAGFGSAATNAAHSTGFRCNSNRRHTTPAHDWANYPSYVAQFCERLSGVVIENRPAARVIAQHDSPETLVYCDPPYPKSTRKERQKETYAFEMTDADHAALAEQLHAVQGMVVVSGYACDLYDQDLYAGWERHEKAALGDGAPKRTEVLWLNPRCAEQLKAVAA